MLKSLKNKGKHQNIVGADTIMRNNRELAFYGFLKRKLYILAN